MSLSVKPRLAGRQPSSAVGAPGDDPARSNQSRQARALTITAGPDLLEPNVTATSQRHRVRAVNPSNLTPDRPDGEPGFWSTGAWREGSPQGARQSIDIGSLAFEAGGVLPQVRIAYETWGTLNPAHDNAIMVEHALTGDSHVSGLAGLGHPTPGWWEGLIGPGCPLDTDRWFVVASNVIGGCQGTTGPSSQAPDGRPWGSRFPFVTVRDQVAAEAALSDRLGISSWAAVLGGSMGGMRALEWAVTYPERVRRCIVLACSAYASAEQIAWCQPQLLAIRQDPDFAGGDYYGRSRGPELGLGLARRIAQVTYRSELELDTRFGRAAQGNEPV